MVHSVVKIEDSHWMTEGNTKQHQEINVWMAIINETNIGPYFFKENVTGER